MRHVCPAGRRLHRAATVTPEKEGLPLAAIKAAERAKVEP